MRVLLMVVLISLGTQDIDAQKLYGKLGFKIINISNANELERNKSLSSLTIGMMSRWKIISNLEVETGFSIGRNGSDTETLREYGWPIIISRVKATYLEIPLTLNYSFRVIKRYKLFVHGGPYIALPIGGRTKHTEYGIVQNETRTIKFSSSAVFKSHHENQVYSELKSIDYGINFGLGFHFGKILLIAHYGMGLQKVNAAIRPDSDFDNNYFRSGGFSIGIPIIN